VDGEGGDLVGHFRPLLPARNVLGRGVGEYPPDVAERRAHGGAAAVAAHEGYNDVLRAEVAVKSREEEVGWLHHGLGSANEFMTNQVNLTVIAVMGQTSYSSASRTSAHMPKPGQALLNRRVFARERTADCALSAEGRTISPALF
jgi:hypothetical protein